ncbi:hypothetical protein [Loktanella sp. SALINAS62]|uniref:hypothetical protein n=1 Tax=Loktanella sp. SALINAS62 TaxID=2706124 RepID=UPI001B8C63CE|nr:hypothetical protein [Loktanella sp. SALINAS62]MBS1302312.1 hypothetical protein [Loktanella sp. SALINAS62]
MKHFISLLLVLFVTANAAQAACFADYKAKRDGPLRLHYGVAEIEGPCTTESAAAQLRPKLQSDGWELLTVVGTFDDSGLDSRKDSAGEYFLRY